MEGGIRKKETGVGGWWEEGRGRTTRALYNKPNRNEQLENFPHVFFTDRRIRTAFLCVTRLQG